MPVDVRIYLNTLQNTQLYELLVVTSTTPITFMGQI